jgi:hypothetical protein
MGFGGSRKLEETVKRGSDPHVAKRENGATYGDMTEQRFGEMKFRTRDLGMSIRG